MRNLLFHLCLQKRNCAAKTFTVLEWLIELCTLPDEKCLNRKLWEIFIHCNCLTELLLNTNEHISHCKSMSNGCSIHLIYGVHSSMCIINQSLTLFDHFFDKLVKLLLRYYSSALVNGLPRHQSLQVISVPWSFIHQYTCYSHDHWKSVLEYCFYFTKILLVYCLLSSCYLVKGRRAEVIVY